FAWACRSEFPQQLAGVAVTRFKGAVQDADKDDIICDRRRREHVSFVLLFQNWLAGGRVHHVIETGIGSGKIDFPINHRGGSDDPAECVIEFPLFFARRGVERIELRIAAASIDHAINYCGRGMETDMIVTGWVLTGSVT